MFVFFYEHTSSLVQTVGNVSACVYFVGVCERFEGENSDGGTRAFTFGASRFVAVDGVRVLSIFPAWAVGLSVRWAYVLACLL